MTPLQSSLLSQFLAAIRTLENTIRACPDELWVEDREGGPFWYLAYHTLFYLDFYLADSPEGFAPPVPFGLTEFDPGGAMPERIYAREELLAYLEHGRSRCRRRVEDLTDEGAAEITHFNRRAMPRLELLIYNLRHVQHHAAQLNLLLRRRTGHATPWVPREASPFPSPAS